MKGTVVNVAHVLAWMRDVSPTRATAKAALRAESVKRSLRAMRSAGHNGKFLQGIY